MNIKLKNGNKLEPETIDSFESALAARLPHEYRLFLAQFDGAYPEPNIFPINQVNSCTVSRFIPLKEILRESKVIALPPNNFLPIARAEGGNYVLICLTQGGSIYFWDHELREPLIKLADGIPEFLEQIRPLDPHSIKLKPGQVKRAWIDPEFLKNIGMQ